MQWQPWCSTDQEIPTGPTHHFHLTVTAVSTDYHLCSPTGQQLSIYHPFHFSIHPTAHWDQDVWQHQWHCWTCRARMATEGDRRKLPGRQTADEHTKSQVNDSSHIYCSQILMPDLVTIYLYRQQTWQFAWSFDSRTGTAIWQIYHQTVDSVARSELLDSLQMKDLTTRGKTEILRKATGSETDIHRGRLGLKFWCVRSSVIFITSMISK